MTAPHWPSHRAEVRPWQQRTVRGPRADRRLREVTVTIPPRIAELEWPLDESLAVMTSASAGNLSQLDLVHGRTLAALNRLLLRTESVDSSRIENLQASLTDYSRALLGVRANASAVAMAASTAALSSIIKDAEFTRLIRPEAILRAHRELFERNPDEQARAGKWRTVQNWIGGSDYAPNGASYVPPPPDLVEPLIEDLLAFANRDDLPPIMQAAIVHAQFESIHPFIDGNGRIGRTLIHAVLRRRRVTRHLTVPVASGVVADRDRYFATLTQYCEGNPRPIIELLARSTNTAATEAKRTADNLLALREEWQGLAGDPKSGTLLFRVLDLIAEDPMIDLATIARRFKASEDEALQVVATLKVCGVLDRVPRTRERPVWVANRVLDEVAQLSARILKAEGPAPPV